MFLAVLLFSVFCVLSLVFFGCVFASFFRRFRLRAPQQPNPSLSLFLLVVQDNNNKKIDKRRGGDHKREKPFFPGFWGIFGGQVW